ncbi:MAG: alpha/beta fold hydrolase [Thermoanaerobacteraceae bacterium]|nr:alpha/beta fold hydrolase [Thermoanaerobacteraceae bacterium]
MARLKVGEIELNYQLHGSGFPVVFISGTGTDHTTWLPVVTSFTGYNCVLFDNRGIGQTDVPPGPYTTAQMADDVAGLIESLGMEKVFLVGISLGSAIAQQVMIRNPRRVQGAVLLGTWAKTDGFIAGLLELWADLQAVLSPRDYARMLLFWAASPAFINRRPDFIEPYLERVSAMNRPVAGYRAQVGAVKSHDTLELLGQIQVPVLVCHGVQDMVVPVEHGRQVASLIPRAQYNEFDGTGHLLPVERGPELIPLILDFFKACL